MHPHPHILAVDAQTFAWIGIVAAGLGLLGVAIYSWRYRPRLRIRIRPGQRLGKPIPGLSADKVYLAIEATNIGGSSITLNRAWFTEPGNPSERRLVKGEWEPRADLGRGQSATIFHPQEGLDLLSLDEICVRDATGRVWKEKVTRAI